MAAAINAADRSLDLVISFLRLADPLLGLPDNPECIRGSVIPEHVSLFSNAGSRPREHKTAFRAVGEAREQSRPRPDDHERYEGQQQVDCEPRGYALLTLMGHGGVPRAPHSVPEERKRL
jgi:hypothetical protein